MYWTIEIDAKKKIHKKEYILYWITLAFECLVVSAFLIKWVELEWLNILKSSYS